MQTMATTASPDAPFTAVEMARKRAFEKAKRHSRLVHVLRIALPVLAVASLGLYFIGGAVSFRAGNMTASVEGISLATDNLRMTNPRMEGVTDDNGRYVVTAESATHEIESPELVFLTAIDARLTQPENKWTHMVAKQGRFHTKNEILGLSGGIHVESANGMTARLDSAEVDIAAQSVVSREPVEVDMLNGNVKAQGMQLNAKDRTIVFEGDVRVRVRKRASADKAAAARTQ